MISRRELARYRMSLRGGAAPQAERGDLTEHRGYLTSPRAWPSNGDAGGGRRACQYAKKRTLPEWLADQLASLAGSWSFIVGFCLALAIWIAFNAWRGDAQAFDPSPVHPARTSILSCVAALQAPVIMMSQKRQEAKTDCPRRLNDYQVNLKAGTEIRNCTRRSITSISKQWQRLKPRSSSCSSEMMADRQH